MLVTYRHSDAMITNHRTAIFPGSFDPITNGHIDVLLHALKVFPKVIIAVAQNVSKMPLFSVEERIAFMQDAVGGIQGVVVTSFEGLLVDFAKREKAVAIVRGLRATIDYELETQMALMNRHLYPELETVFFLSTEESAFVSSSMIKQVASLGGDVSGLVPKGVQQALRERFRKGASAGV